MTELNDKRRRVSLIVIGYPFVLLGIGLAINIWAFGISPAVPALPSPEHIWALAVAGSLLVINHAWLMTTTELTRVKFRMYATPEEWGNSKTTPQDISKLGWQELERHHNAHRNTTENVVYFVFLAAVLAVTSPHIWAAKLWMIGFAVARLGYTYSYISGRDNLRGLFMSLSLLAMFAMASYLLVSVVS
ncbi:MAPEG family protein [Sedimentitalea sp. CY04]|uniref:Microsomal glutathione S-transferase 1 n=1 Tax=Parasedimentitalea denitrificans TaxID=2211118 RepID=A0ABX0W832_9RHOB|nr:MAPEG family protein [Sedimentitalea sp. CY04]NIZ61826.1 MAPEG family protein [Sedimentitalea sp. CY04]